MIVDTSVFIAFYHESDVHHREAVEKFQDIDSLAKNDTIIISDYQLNEIVSVALRKMGLAKSKIILELLLNHESMLIRHTSSQEFYSIIDVFKSQDKNLNFVDCSIVWLANNAAQKVVSFDGNLIGYLG